MDEGRGKPDQRLIGIDGGGLNGRNLMPAQTLAHEI
jgi:hypothetical protein